MVKLRFDLADSLTGRIKWTVLPETWEFTDPVSGSGSGSLVLPIPADQDQVQTLRMYTDPLLNQVVIRDERNVILFGGPITGREPDDTHSKLTVKFADWRWWFYRAQLDRIGNVYVDSNGDYLRSNTEQVTIMRELVALALADTGTPPIMVEQAADTGVLRQATFRRFSKIGDALDNIAQRERGPEWWIAMTPAHDPRFVEATFKLGWPERVSRPTRLRAEYQQTSAQWTPLGGNITEPPAWPEDSSNQTARMVALGDGDPPDQISAVDEDPDLASGRVLLTESTAGPFQGVTQRATAFEHAFDERAAVAAPITSVDIPIRVDNPHVGDYQVGDRIQLRIKTNWVDQLVNGARIITKVVSGGADEVNKATLTVNLNDDIGTAGLSEDEIAAQGGTD